MGSFIPPNQLGRFLSSPVDPSTVVLYADNVWRPASSGSGTVTSVALSAPTEFNVGGSPVTTSGTLALTWANQSSNTFFAGPLSGPPGTPGFRAIDPADLAGTPAAGKYWDGTGTWMTLPPPGTGTVTSVDVAVPTELLSSGGPITASGTITLSWVNESSNLVFAGPASGPPGTPAFRSLVTADFPTTGVSAGSYTYASITVDATGRLTSAANGTAPVTSVALSAPSAEFTVSGSPVTSTGTLTFVWKNQNANLVFAGPSSGPAATPSFRSLVAADIPSLSYVTSVAMTVPSSELAIGGSPITSSGTLALTWQTQSANRVFAGPATGSPATPTFRALVAADFPAGTGTVTSVAIAVPADLSVAGSPITTAGTITLAWQNQSANTFHAGPASGAAATPTWRTMVAEDIGTGTATANFIPVSTGVGAKPAWQAITPTVLGFTTGKDRNRPAAAAGNFYLGTDTGQYYASTSSAWFLPGVGTDKVTTGDLAGAFTDAIFWQSAAGANSGPIWGNNRTIAIGFYVLSLPGTGGGILISMNTSGGFANGYLFGNSTVNSNKLRFVMSGVSGSASIEINATVSAGFHVLAANYVNGTGIRFSFDGGTVGTAATTGTYTVPISTTQLTVGRYTGGGGFFCGWADFGFLYEWPALLSDADLQTIGSALPTFQPGIISTDPSYMWESRWMNNGSAAAGTPGYPAFGSNSNKSCNLSAQGVGIYKTNR